MRAQTTREIQSYEVLLEVQVYSGLHHSFKINIPHLWMAKGKLTFKSTMCRKQRIPSAQNRTPLHGVPCRQALRSMTLPDVRSPLISVHPFSSHSPAWHIQTNLAAEKTAINRQTHGVNNSPLSLLLVYDFRIIHPPKNAAPFSSALTWTTPQSNARYIPKKWAGAETTFRTAWIEYQILPRFCFNDPPTGEGSKQVETAVVRGVYN